MAPDMLYSSIVRTNNKHINGWKIRGWVEWWFATLSFVAFILIESAIVYSYYVLLKHHAG